MTRVEAALSEIARRRELAQAADGPLHPFFTVHGDPFLVRDPARAPFTVVATVSVRPNDYGRANAQHLAAAADPAHVLAVLDAAEAVLRRHTGPVLCALCSNDFGPWPCPDAAAVLDIYAPEATP